MGSKTHALNLRKTKPNPPDFRLLTTPEGSKSEAYQRIEEILESGPFVPGTRAVHRAHFLYALRWSQVAARVTEMNRLGWQIASVTLPEIDWQNGVRTAYRLDRKPLPSGQDWYEHEHGPRPSDKSKQNEIVLPLFEGQR